MAEKDICFLLQGKIEEKDTTGLEDCWVNQVLSFSEKGRDHGRAAGVFEGPGVANSRNALTGFEKLE